MRIFLLTFFFSLMQCSSLLAFYNKMTFIDSCMPFPESRFITLQNVRIHCRVWEAQGNAKGNILFIHGFSGSTFSWRKNTDVLAANGYNVVALDLPPYGFSDKPAKYNYSVTANAALVWKVLEELYPDQKEWILIGHSMGGNTAFAANALYPEKVKAMICIDGGGLVSQNPKWITRIALKNPVTYITAELVGKLFFFKYKRIEKLLLSAYGQPPEREAIEGYLRGLKQKRTAGKIMAAAASKEIFKPTDERLPSKLLFIWGEKDNWLPLKGGLGLRNKYPLSELYIVKEAGHCPMETHSTEVNQKIIEFLGD